VDAFLEYQREIDPESAVTVESINPRYYPKLNDRLLKGIPKTPAAAHSWPPENSSKV